MDKFILTNILWNLGTEPIDSKPNFNIALKEYNERITQESFEVDLNKPTLYIDKVVIQYSHWDEEEDDIVEPSFLLEADNKTFFTTGELLFKIHNKVCEKLKDEDNKFFEGLDLYEGYDPNYPNTPLYFLAQGS